MTEKCRGSEVRINFDEAHTRMADSYRNRVAVLVLDNEEKVKDMMSDWTDLDRRPVDCVTSLEFPWNSFTQETKFLMMSKLSKEIKCDEDCSANFVDDPKRTWFVEMKNRIIDMRRSRLDTNDETCKMSIVELQKDNFTKMRITEQEEILNKIENHCFSDLYDTYQKWYDFHGQDVKCMAQLGGTYPNPGVSDYDGKCPGKYFLYGMEMTTKGYFKIIF